MIYEDQFGHRTYYYYKKKVGRPKKRGPKKKKKKRGCKHQEPWNYKIVLCNFKKQDSVIGYFHTLDEATNAKKILLEENKGVIIPKRLYSVHAKNKKFIEYDSEYILLEKIRDDSSNITKLRNEYGKIVEHTTTNQKWKIIDKFDHKIEETFWVYGYNPRTDRKDFNWIYENFITDYLNIDNTLIIRVYIYYNKIVLRYDDEDINFIICKNKSDAITFYNTIEKNCKKNKRVILTGIVKNRSEIAEKIISLIKEKTGWNNTKIMRPNTL